MRFPDLKTLLARASPPRSGDDLAGISANSAQERVAAQMALADLQTSSESRISVLLGVPPYLLGLPSAEGSSAPYQNVQAVFDYWWRATLFPHGRHIADALGQWAIPAGTDLILDASSYTQPGPLERAQYYDVMAKLGAMTVDEIRAAERMPPLTGEPAVPRVEQVPAAAG